VTAAEAGKAIGRNDDTYPKPAVLHRYRCGYWNWQSGQKNG